MNEEVEVVVFDLDHTLIKTDLLQEQVLIAIKKSLFNIVPIMGAIFKGRLYLKNYLSQIAPIDPSTLPYNDIVLSLAQKSVAEKKRVLLISASIDSEVKKIAAHLGIFSEAHGSKNNNLKGINKVNFIKDQLKLNQWSYVGDSYADLPVWRESSKIYLVQPSRNLTSLVKLQNSKKSMETLSTETNFFKTYIKGLRVHQWVKNILVFCPLILAHKYSDRDSVIQTGLAFILFSFIASAIYILNDLFDLNADRLHIKKRERPWANGDLSISVGVASFIIFTFIPLFLAFHFDQASGFLLLSYLILNLLYTFKLKSLLIIDVIVLALMYNLRILFGGLMTDIPISPWLLTFSVFFFLGLAFIKRFAELKKHSLSSKQNSRAYLKEDQSMISTIGVSSSLLSVLVFSLYLNSPTVLDLYHYNNYLWLITPSLLYWVSRIWILVHRGSLDDDPIVFAIKDKATYIVGLFIFCILIFSI